MEVLFFDSWSESCLTVAQLRKLVAERPAAAREYHLADSAEFISFEMWEAQQSQPISDAPHRNVGSGA